MKPLRLFRIALLGTLIIVAGCATPGPQTSAKLSGPGLAAAYYAASPNQPSPYNTQQWPYNP